MRPRGFAYPLLVAKTLSFGMLYVCRAKREWVKHKIESHEIQDSNVVLGGFMLGEAPMRHMKLPLVKCGSLLRGEVGWVRAGLCGVWT